MPRHDPLVRLRHMLDYAREAVDIAAPRSRAQLQQERMFALALTRCVIVMGEAARRVDTDIQARYPDVPWGDITGMHDHLVHDYDVIDFDALWSTVTTDLPPLIEQLERIIAEEEVE